MCNTLQLIKGIEAISTLLLKTTGLNIQITAIQFEDGSGNKFNYQTDGHADWFFVDLTGKI